MKVVRQQLAVVILCLMGMMMANLYFIGVTQDIVLWGTSITSIQDEPGILEIKGKDVRLQMMSMDYFSLVGSGLVGDALADIVDIVPAEGNWFLTPKSAVEMTFSSDQPIVVIWSQSHLREADVARVVNVAIFLVCMFIVGYLEFNR